MDGDQVFKIPCHKAVVTHLKVYKELVYQYQAEHNFSLANKVIFGYLKYYDTGLAQYDGIDKDLSVVIDYIYAVL